jgi:hypothetical protein
MQKLLPIYGRMLIVAIDLERIVVFAQEQLLDAIALVDEKVCFYAIKK